MLSDFLRVGVLSSKRAPGLEGLLHHPFRGKSFEIERGTVTFTGGPPDTPTISAVAR